MVGKKEKKNEGLKRKRKPQSRIQNRSHVPLASTFLH